MSLRSALFMPASNARAIEKARTLAADAIILDLEDAVAPDAKAGARDQAVGAARDGGFGARPLVLRINGLDSDWGADDCRAAADAGFDAVLLPKVSSPDNLAAARALLGPVPLWAMIESCAAMLALPMIVAAARANDLRCLILGPNDLAKDMRCTPGADRLPLQPHLVAIVTAARAYGLIALDGVCNAIGDDDRLTAECAQGARFGFDGKTLIHPSQIAIANAAFAPSGERIAWAERVIAAFALPEHADKGAIQLDGEMVERLHLEQARRVMSLG
ncbi:CoA ester lyase [Sphingomonas sp. AR_OL41]|jgi:citrate lyase subunit beta/citryl-CoA lyase|uniref:HpcH/HpaI aldolase/citrate lyase family protein n=1 Tax=Sphingomonas sp. AR_OL41 TaxID=3042729 RepID=UPI00247FCC02|nr:CoA ester lyase [Sphingomonas sp. AR_OL41]MDH7972374.1 CoA ester lyase [Sphingomonas sp. AR_OL41]